MWKEIRKPAQIHRQSKIKYFYFFYIVRWENCLYFSSRIGLNYVIICIFYYTQCDPVCTAVAQNRLSKGANHETEFIKHGKKTEKGVITITYARKWPNLFTRQIELSLINRDTIVSALRKDKRRLRPNKFNNKNITGNFWEIFVN